MALDIRDLVSSKKLIDSVQNLDEVSTRTGVQVEDIDWDAELTAAVTEAERLTDNNDFGMLNDYYTTYIGRKLEQQKDKDSNLSYSVSKEYGDLKVLLDICKLKGIEPLLSMCLFMAIGVTIPVLIRRGAKSTTKMFVIL